MADPVPLVEVWRGDAARVAPSRPRGRLRRGGRGPRRLGRPRRGDLPALVLQDAPGAAAASRAAPAAGLSSERLALACASHQGAAIHVDARRRLARRPRPRRGRPALRAAGPRRRARAPPAARRGPRAACQLHNNCSGKHAGFLTLNRHLGGGPGIRRDRPPGAARRARRLRGDDRRRRAPAGAIDGCSAPNFATTVARPRPGDGAHGRPVAARAGPRRRGAARWSRRCARTRCSSPARAGPAPS